MRVPWLLVQGNPVHGASEPQTRFNGNTNGPYHVGNFSARTASRKEFQYNGTARTQYIEGEERRGEEKQKRMEGEGRSDMYITYIYICACNENIT